MPDRLPDDLPYALLEEFCARNELTVGARLAGGLVSTVHLAHTAAGTPVVVKVSDRCPVSEAAWLARHRHAPRVLAVDETFAALALEHVDSRLLVEDPPRFDLAREADWLALAHEATGPTQPGDDVLVDRYRAAFDAVRDRPAARPWASHVAAGWLEWAAGLDRSSWQSVAMDVIFKNTLVDRAGSWWAIDPLCATAPPPVVFCPWVIDRTAKASAGKSPAEVVAQQETLLERAPDPDVAAAWMPGALLWTLWGADISTPRHGLYLDLLDHWARRWVER